MDGVQVVGGDTGQLSYRSFLSYYIILLRNNSSTMAPQLNGSERPLDPLFDNLGEVHVYMC